MSNKSEDFRRRRLSVSDIDTSEFGKGEASSPSANGKGRGRRLSMSPEMGAKTTAETAPHFKLDACGTYSCHGVEPGQRQGETTAKINQDRGAIVYPFGPEDKYALFCVYDGHGANGDKVSQYVATNVPDLLATKLEKKEPIEKAMKETFVEVDAALKKNRQIDAELSGTTAVVVLYEFLPEPGKGKMYAANAGDSRAVMQSKGKKVMDLTEDQKPNTPAEQARITKAGGYVSPPEEEWGGPARVWLDKNMTLPGLAMARSLGDHLVKSVGVTAEPVVTTFDVDTSRDEYIVMASDGVWDVMTDVDAQDLLLAHAHESGDELAERVVKQALSKGTRDNLSCLVIRLK